MKKHSSEMGPVWQNSVYCCRFTRKKYRRRQKLISSNWSVTHIM